MLEERTTGTPETAAGQRDEESMHVVEYVVAIVAVVAAFLLTTVR